MQIHLAAKLVLVCIVGSCLSACMSSGTLRMTQPQSQAIAPGRTVALTVAPDVAEPQPVHQDVADRVRDRLATKLVAAGIFTAVVPSPASADYRMDVKIRGARQVSPVLRALLGAMAGPNTLASVVQVQDRRSNQEVAGFAVTGTSASHPLAPHADLDDAVREAVDKMIQALR